MDASNANARLFAVHQPVARDLRLVLTLSRAIYDLERISGEAVRLADIAENLYEYQLTAHECAIFEDVACIATPALDLLARSMQSLADEDVRVAVGVALEHVAPRRQVVGDGGHLGVLALAIALARAFLKDAPMLILDEATANLDPEQETMLQETMERLMQDRTVLILAHRLSTVYGADQIIVLDGGRVVESGTHTTLLEEGQLYRQLVTAYSVS